jgi:hypothetical protein
MIITGSALFVQPGSSERVKNLLRKYPQVTFQVQSDSGTELIVNLEVENQVELDRLCALLKEEITEIVDVAHVYMNMEDEIKKFAPDD